jgi:hypothetical protein
MGVEVVQNLRRQQTSKTEMGMLTWMSLESGWEARTPVQVRSERLSAATASMDLGGAAAAPLEEEEGATGALAPLLAAAAAFFLLASETMMMLALSSWAGGRWRAEEEWWRRIGRAGQAGEGSRREGTGRGELCYSNLHRADTCWSLGGRGSTAGRCCLSFRLCGPSPYSR